MHYSAPVRSLVLALALTTGCLVGTEPSPVDSPSVFIVSQPVAGPPAAHAGAAFSSAGPADLGTVYVSLPPGIAPSGVAATIRNRRSGSEAAAFLFDGGFDPMGIAAGAGDTLELEVHRADGGTVLSALATVPAARRPVIVRSSPPPKKRDVPLNSVMVVVFSEPIDPRTLTATSLRLVAGGSGVSGRITLTADGLRAEFAPDQLLQPSTTYILALTSSVADLAGELLEPSTFDFTTASSAAGVGMSQIAFWGGCPQADSTPPNPSAPVCGIFAMNADGSDVRLLSQPLNAGDNDAYPAWSPDGRKIAFTSYRHCTLSGSQPGPACKPEIYVMNADGSGLTKLTDLNAIGLGGYGAAWSPDGRTIAFPTYTGIYAVNADGSGLRTLTTAAAGNGGPSWSPDGARIAFSASTPGAGAPDSGGIWVMNADGSNVGRITFGSHDAFPSWSPDGTRIAFQRANDSLQEQHVYVMSADGLNPTQLTTGFGINLTPSWSPDGTQIAFKRYVGASGAAEIDVMRADGSGAVRRVSGYTNVSGPAWSPVGSVPALPVPPPPAAYSLTLTQSTLSITQGSGAYQTVQLIRSNSATVVTLSVENLPTGVSAFFHPQWWLPGGNFSLSLHVAPDAPTGTFTDLVVRGVASGLADRTAPLTLTIGVAPFALTLSPSTLSVEQGASAPGTTVRIVRGNFTGPVDLYVDWWDRLPPGVTAVFAPSPMTGDSSVLYLTASAAAEPGVYDLYVFADAAGTTGWCCVPLTLTVTARSP